MFKFKYFIALVLMIAFVGCSSNYSRDDYFGYSNDPDKYANQDEQQDTQDLDDIALLDNQNDNANWVNPLSKSEPVANNSQGINNNVSNRTVSASSTSSVMYVPVLVPWWNDYYGWYDFRPRSRFAINYYHGFYNHYSWYSPWYDHHPYYGYNWHNRWHRNYYTGFYGWHRQPVYTYQSRPVRKQYTYRNAGPSRGGYIYGRGTSTRTTSRTGGALASTRTNATNYNPVATSRSSRSVVPVSSSSSSSKSSRTLSNSNSTGNSSFIPRSERHSASVNSGASSVRSGNSSRSTKSSNTNVRSGNSSSRSTGTRYRSSTTSPKNSESVQSSGSRGRSSGVRSSSSSKRNSGSSVRSSSSSKRSSGSSVRSSGSSSRSSGSSSGSSSRSSGSSSGGSRSRGR